MFKRKSMIAAAVVAGSIGFASAASAQSIVALVGNNTLTVIDFKTKKMTSTAQVKGVQLIGIDVRPADGMLYGVSTDGQVGTLDPKTGVFTKKADLSEKLKAGVTATIDFNPAADRLRIMGSDGTSLRANVDDGKVTVDGSHKYAENDPNKGKTPRVIAGSYSNSIKGTKETALYNIDAANGTLVRQAPPNDGVLNTIGALGIKLNGPAAFDIQAAGEGDNNAWLLNGGMLYKIDLKTGKATPMGPLAIKGQVTDIAYMN
jgi:outer membrane protein assembly factor BamB